MAGLREQTREHTLWFVSRLVSKLVSKLCAVVVTETETELDVEESGKAGRKSAPEKEVACIDIVQGMFVARI